MFSPFVTLSLALALVQGLAIPSADEFLARRSAAPLQLDFNVVRNAKGNATIAVKSLEKYRNNSSDKKYTPVGLDGSDDIEYLADVYLGTEHEKVTVQLDTGSSDLWVYDSSFWDPSGGSFDPSSSTHDVKTPQEFSIEYVDLTKAEGYYHKDDFSFSSDSSLLQNFEFGVVNSSTSSGYGILGIGVKYQEVNSVPYDNLPLALANNGVTPKASYSLFLGPEEEGKGTIIFGGIDTEKYSGSLTKYPIKGKGLGLTVESAQIGGESVSLGQHFFLDSGTSLNLWPKNLLEAVAKELGYYYSADGLYYVPCSQPSDKFINFNFEQNSVRVPYSDLTISVLDLACVLGAEDSADYFDNFILGDIFLRSAYVYYDLTDETISIAQANYTTSSNIISA